MFSLPQHPDHASGTDRVTGGQDTNTLVEARTVPDFVFTDTVRVHMPRFFCATTFLPFSVHDAPVTFHFAVPLAGTFSSEEAFFVDPFFIAAHGATGTDSPETMALSPSGITTNRYWVPAVSPLTVHEPVDDVHDCVPPTTRTVCLSTPGAGVKVTVAERSPGATFMIATRTDSRCVVTFGPSELLQLLDQTVDEEAAEVVISTVHRSKGREWRRVRCAGDFPAVDKMDKEELMVAYVAMTRARDILDISSWIPPLNEPKWKQVRTTHQTSPPPTATQQPTSQLNRPLRDRPPIRPRQSSTADVNDAPPRSSWLRRLRDKL